MLIRQMRESELNFAVACTEAEGWQSETKDLFESFLLHDPAGCFIAEEKGREIGVCVATPYESSGFLGELVVTPEARGRFVGPRLLDHAIHYLKVRGIANIHLEGEIAASPYYEHVGFRKISRSLRFIGRTKPVNHPHVRPIQEADMEEIYCLDKTAFGDDRSFFIQRKRSLYPRFSKVIEEEGRILGYIMAQQGIGVIAVGPWVVQDAVARPLDLLESLALETGDTPIRLGILEKNAKAVETVRSVDTLADQEYCWRMVLGASDRLGNSDMCYTIGAPAKG